jgi:hypothetical protein
MSSCFAKVYEDVDVAGVGVKVGTQDGAKEGEAGNLPLLTELDDGLFG